MSLVRLFCVLFVAGVSARTIRSTEEKVENEVANFSCKCDRRYWAHYEAKGCHPVFEEGRLDCPTRFDCSDIQKSDSEKCLLGGLYYDVGSSINTSNPCDKCYCSRSESTNSSFIPCVNVECPEFFGGRLKEGCHYVYSEDQCCPVKTECEIKESPKCNWNNKTYHLGEKIYPKEDFCLICLCNENWEGLSSKSCRKLDCLIEKDLHLLQQGCIPIYHEETCCPIEYHCPERAQKNEEAEKSTLVDKDPNQCYFDGRAYNRGEMLDYNHTTNCVTCTCCMPPDFTCIHQSCPQPSLGYDKCRSIYRPGTCCPDYDCSAETEVKKFAGISEEKETEIIDPLHEESPCIDLHCEEEKYCQLRQICEESSCRIYPQCVSINANCPTPLCAAGCYVVDIDKDKCPTCVCGNNSLTRKEASKMCVLPNCTGSNCHLVSNEDGCPACSCDPPCPPCPSSCQVQVDIPEGRCPECICNEIVEKSNVETVSCPEPICHGVNCSMRVGEDNCTHCICIECSLPKCDPGCKLETVSGGCPKCECPSHENTEAIATSCSVPVCNGINCTMKIGEDNCTHCVCLQCSVPNCEPACKLETNISEGCPKCECPKHESTNDHTTTSTTSTTTTTTKIIDTSSTETQKCPELKCRGYNCRILIGTNGCQFCTCESKCPPTKCIPGCFVDKNPLPDQCPGCICHVAATSKDVASNES